MRSVDTLPIREIFAGIVSLLYIFDECCVFDDLLDVLFPLEILHAKFQL